MLICCSECRYRSARPRRTQHGPDVWCNHPGNPQSVPQGVLDVETARVSCAFQADERAGQGEPVTEPVVRMRRRIPVTVAAPVS